MAAIQKTGPYTDEIIPPELWPTTHEAAASAATSFCDARQESESAADTYRVAAQRLSETSQGATREALITVHRELAVDHDNHAAIREAVAKAAKQAAERGYELIDRLKAIDFQAHQEIAASPPSAREAIIDGLAPGRWLRMPSSRSLSPATMGKQLKLSRHWWPGS